MSGALFGQGLNFLAMLLPIIGQETGQLAYLMLPLALATVLSRTSILSFHSKYTTIDDGMTETATATSAVTLLSATALCFVVGVSTMTFPAMSSSDLPSFAIWTAVLLLTNGIYFMSVAIATREQRMDVYSTARLVFGVTNIVVTALVVFIVPFQAGLIVAAALNPLIGAVLILSRTSNRVFDTLWREKARLIDSEHRGYLVDSARPTGGVFLAEIGFQFQAFITPFLGPYQEIWAVVVRLTGGFGTLAQQIIAPPCEAKIAHCIRTGDIIGTRRWCRTVIFVGLALGVGGGIVQICAVLFSLSEDTSVTPWSLLLIGIYCLAWMPSAMCGKIPIMKGLNNQYLFWSVTRLVLLLALIPLRDHVLFVGIIGVMSITSIHLVWVSLRTARRH
ncbi:hypothetical protein ACTXMA_05530 [Corynebacterium variabile]|uniref:hypothetical protein n=2 Tax=Corynebacterium variabile TaxID=1727 RepID=UPI003F91AABA